MKRVANRDASSYVAALKEFNGSNTFAREVAFLLNKSYNYVADRIYGKVKNNIKSIKKI